MSISDNLKKKKAAIYIRVSTRYQVDRDSLQVQRRELSVYSEMVLGIPDYVIFEDAGYSAKNTDRPDYQLMMGRLRTGEFSHLLVWKIDRISRNLLDFAAMYKELKDLGVAFVSKNEQFDTSNAVGEAMRRRVYAFMEKLMAQGQQCYVVCPLVEESETVDLQEIFLSRRDSSRHQGYLRTQSHPRI